jgi:antitoxin component YwqK of YwqJK toxin-antitoxin module
MTFESFSQNDTLQLFDNYILFQGKKYNRIINGVKQGKWIDFIIMNDYGMLEYGSGVNTDSGQEIHFENDVQIEYRPLKTTEKEGDRIVLYKSVDTTSIGIIYYASVKEIHSIVPGNQFYITAMGRYKDDLKIESWTFYHRTGEIKKEIDYLNGLPTTGFKIFRDNGVLMFDVIRLNNTDWNICRYSETGKLLDCELKKIDEFSRLYE